MNKKIVLANFTFFSGTCTRAAIEHLHLTSYQFWSVLSIFSLHDYNIHSKLRSRGKYGTVLN